ncbi:hypothetical protein Taro_028232 [Colocasia esculenta]|uniref:Uncharacterized protein n=1 Tax=Colocasia esculenta TaxID=4460 RepID=A0A843VWP2_COLES|nr:hypothetical protein [Colocasia esculenta]
MKKKFLKISYLGIPLKTPETIFPETLDTSFPLPIRETPKPSTCSHRLSPRSLVCSRRRGSVAASEEEEEEEVSSPACSLTACFSSCIREPPRSFAPVAEVQADPLLLLTLDVRCVAGNISSSTPHVVESTAVGSKPPCLPLPSLAEVGGVDQASRSGCLYGWSSSACLDLCM